MDPVVANAQQLPGGREKSKAKSTQRADKKEVCHKKQMKPWNSQTSGNNAEPFTNKSLESIVTGNFCSVYPAPNPPILTHRNSPGP